MKIQKSMWIFLLITLSGCVVMPTTHKKYKEWNEEVLLSSGEIVVIHQKRQCDKVGKYDNGNEYCSALRNAEIEFILPELSQQKIQWSASLLPLVLNKYNSELYIIGMMTGVSYTFHSKSAPLYLAYKWESGGWVSILVEDVPHEIYKTNLVVGFPNNNNEIFDLISKKIFNDRPTLGQKYKEIII